MSEPVLRLVVVDDHEMVVQGIVAMLTPLSGAIEVVGTALDPPSAMAVIAEVKPDMVLCDVRLHGSSGLDLCAALHERYPSLDVVFLTVYDDEQYLYQALRAGARGFLLKQIDGPQLVRSLQAVARGETIIDESLAGRVATAAAHMRTGEFWPGAQRGLTQRESEVLGLLVSGLSNRAIASKLVVSDDTVKSHLRGLYRKLDVNDRGSAIAVALREGIFH